MGIYFTKHNLLLNAADPYKL